MLVKKTADLRFNPTGFMSGGIRKKSGGPEVPNAGGRGYGHKGFAAD